MGNAEIWIVLAALVIMVALLAMDRLRPGLILFSVVVIFMCFGILTPGEVVEGFSNKGMITVALLFLVSEGVRRSDCLGHLMERLLSARKGQSVRSGYARIVPTVSFVSAFLNNTPLVVIFIPIIKQWARKAQLPAKKFLIPLSYAAILGGMCTLIGTSTNLVVHGLMLEAGFEGFTMFELGKVGVVVAAVGSLYLIFFGERRLPACDDSEEIAEEEDDAPEGDAGTQEQRVEVVLGPRFPGINTPFREFDFKSHYNAKVREVRRGGETQTDLDRFVFRRGDTLVLDTDGNFIRTWGDSSVFLMVSNGSDHYKAGPKWKKWLALGLLVVMIVGATFGSMPFMKRISPDVSLDMFFWACVVTIAMAFFNLFPAKKYTKFISWDILVTIACALAISRAMTNSGLADAIASFLIDISGSVSPWVVLAILYITTNVITEFITNNAAAAFAFPVALSAATQLGVDPMPFFVAICIAASASFSCPIGYQTNMIVQGIGNYRFGDFVRVGLPLNLIAFLLSVVLIPLFWQF